MQGQQKEQVDIRIQKTKMCYDFIQVKFQCRTCMVLYPNTLQQTKFGAKGKVWAKKQNVAVLFVLQTLLLKDSLARI